MTTNPSLPASRIGVPDLDPVIDNERTGRIDAILFGRVIDLLDAATRRLAASTNESRSTFARLDGEVEGIARSASVLSGISVEDLRQGSADRVHRVGR